MKKHNSLPTNEDFFNRYALLIARLALAGVCAQVVSGLTEIGIIYTGSKESLAPLSLGFWVYLLSGLTAIIATFTIEGGLRETFPKAVDAILYHRWSGLDLPISIFLWLLVSVLLLCSGYLSFSNSRVIIDNFTPESEQLTTTTADSIRAVELETATANFRRDSLTIATSYQQKIMTATTAYDLEIRSIDEQLRGYESREARTGSSYATRKDQVRQARANKEAEKASALATIASEQTSEGKALTTRYRSEQDSILSRHRSAVAMVETTNTQAENDRLATVDGYGLGLGAFTLVCLFVFIVSVVLDRIYRKGAGITETVQIESYDFRPSWWTEGTSAVGERIQYWLHSVIVAFADKTPAAPAPPKPGAVYDLEEALKTVTIKVEASGDDAQVVQLEPKQPDQPRRQIGQSIFERNHEHETTENSVDPLYATKKPPTTNHETTKPEGGTNHETPDTRHLKQELKKYKKRVGSHEQKAKVQIRNKGEVSKRTQDAIENNRQWVRKIEGQLKELQA